mmetsp:Transcript_208/g.520  ORF Transcript_208/g.520 Transcript_208/m.520 type:complete len:298 (+) Transcript_208:427-1320(+)
MSPGRSSTLGALAWTPRTSSLGPRCGCASVCPRPCRLCRRGPTTPIRRRSASAAGCASTPTASACMSRIATRPGTRHRLGRGPLTGSASSTSPRRSASGRRPPPPCLSTAASRRNGASSTSPGRSTCVSAAQTADDACMSRPHRIRRRAIPSASGIAFCRGRGSTTIPRNRSTLQAHATSSLTAFAWRRASRIASAPRRTSPLAPPGSRSSVGSTTAARGSSRPYPAFAPRRRSGSRAVPWSCGLAIPAVPRSIGRPFAAGAACRGRRRPACSLQCRSSTSSEQCGRVLPRSIRSEM